MSKNLDKLKRLLAELFQLDQADLDFGIYRIMNQKRDDIVRFLDDDLLPQVKQAFTQYESTDRAAIQTELDQAIESARAIGVDPDSAQKVKELRAKLEESGVDIAALESEVFSHLYSFFRRYYHEGDFLSLRRYKEGVYAIPYEGEEVKLHWANADQYYIKSSEYLRDYTFKLPSGQRVHFKLVEASTEQDNNKAANGKERRFIYAGLATEKILATENTENTEELVIRFAYQPDEQKRKQKQLNEQSVAAVLVDLSTKNPSVSSVPSVANSFSSALSSLAPTEANPNRTLLAKHLNDYTARNTFDYFIHKDLGGFLRRELDFYIKNEVMHLDDIENETAPRVEQYLSKIRALRSIAHKIIAFLEQLENFQKKLWLKKKFVVETNYCVTLDRVPEELYQQIAANDAQREEWVKLFAIDEIGIATEDTETTEKKKAKKKQEDDPKLFSESSVISVAKYSEPLTVEFLKANPFLVLDTRFFDEAFKDALLSSVAILDERTDGLLVHGENSGMLRTCEASFGKQITTIFIDPPYNTGIDGFPYKDSYQHSSWLAMMDERAMLARRIMHPRGLAFITIDFVEVSRLRLLCDDIFGGENFLADIAWEKRYTRSNNAKMFYSLKDTILAYRASSELALIREARSDKSRANYTNPDDDERGDWISSSYVNPATREERPNLVYPIRNPVTEQDVEHPTHAWKYDPVTHAQHISDKRLYWGSDGSYEYPRLKSFLSEAREGMVPIDVWSYQDTGTTDDGGKVLKAKFGSEVFSNPKPPSLVQRCITLDDSSDKESVVLDFFGGSGTTGEAVVTMNREDDGERKYILVEMGDHFDTVLKPRIQKVIYSKDWKDGKPVSREGSSHMFKYIRLESYEDALNNLSLKRTDGQQALLDKWPGVREEYMLSYMLDVESRGSASLLDVTAFDDPYAYKMNIARGDETKAVPVDLVETFNYLIGLTVRHIDHIRGVRVINGTTPSGERVLVLWRKVAETDNDALDKWFTKQGYNSKDMEYDLIYVNGDNNLENLRREDQTWKVRLIEEDFHRLMFDVEDV